MRQLVWEKANSEFKPVKLRLRIDLVSYPARAEGLVNMVTEFSPTVVVLLLVVASTHLCVDNVFIIPIYICVCVCREREREKKRKRERERERERERNAHTQWVNCCLNYPKMKVTLTSYFIRYSGTSSVEYTSNSFQNYIRLRFVQKQKQCCLGRLGQPFGHVWFASATRSDVFGLPRQSFTRVPFSSARLVCSNSEHLFDL